MTHYNETYVEDLIALNRELAAALESVLRAISNDAGNDFGRPWDESHEEWYGPIANVALTLAKVQPQHTPQQEQELDIMRSRGDL